MVANEMATADRVVEEYQARGFAVARGLFSPE